MKLDETSTGRAGSAIASRFWYWFLIAATLVGCGSGNRADRSSQLLNVSFDISRDLFSDLNKAAAPFISERLARPVEIIQSHAGASKQARAIIHGVEAHIVSLNTVTDIDLIARQGLTRTGSLIATNWRNLRPFHSAPYSSVIVFVVRAGNPKRIHDWADLTQPGLTLAVPDPKSSGTGRAIYLSAWASALRRFGGDLVRAEQGMADFYSRVRSLETGSRGATIKFADRRLGDVLITLEAEQHLLQRKYANEHFETIYPSLSLDVEMPVAIVEPVARQHQLWEAANAYLDFLFTEAAQEIMAQNFFRPRDMAVRQRFTTRFPPVTLIDVDRDLGGWDRVMTEHFGAGGRFDRITERRL